MNTRCCRGEIPSHSLCVASGSIWFLTRSIYCCGSSLFLFMLNIVHLAWVTSRSSHRIKPLLLPICFKETLNVPLTSLTLPKMNGSLDQFLITSLKMWKTNQPTSLSLLYTVGIVSTFFVERLTFYFLCEHDYSKINSVGIILIPCFGGGGVYLFLSVLLDNVQRPSKLTRIW